MAGFEPTHKGLKSNFATTSVKYLRCVTLRHFASSHAPGKSLKSSSDWSHFVKNLNRPQVASPTS